MPKTQKRNAGLTQLIVNQARTPKSGFVELWHRRGLHLRISRSGKAWLLRYRFEGKQRRLELGRHPVMTLDGAEAEATKKRELIKAGIDPATVKAIAAAPAPKNLTVRAAAETYLKDYSAKKHRPRTQEEVRRAFEKYIFPEIGGLPLTAVTKGDIKNLQRKIADAGFETHSNRVTAYARGFFNWAVDEDMLEISPALRLKTTKEESRDRVLSDAEIVLFWRAAERLGYPYGDLFRLLLLTAQRRSDCSGIEWSEIDGHDRLWSIPAERMKAGEAHDVHLSPAAWAIIDGASRALRDRRFVFSRVEDKPVCGFSDAKEALDAIMAELNDGEAVPDWRIHDLRRTATTIMARSLKVPSNVADLVIAHKPKGDSGTARTYNRYDYFDERKDALEKLAEYIVHLEERRTGKNVVTLRPAQII